MTKMRRAMLAYCLLAALPAAPALAEGNVNFALGNRSLDEDTWEPAESQLLFGVTVDWEVADWPINLAAGYYGSFGDEESGGADLEATIHELSFGVLKGWTPKGNIRPYAGGGVAFVRADIESEVDLGPLGILKDEDDDTSPGVYGQGGVYWRIGAKFNIGVDGRLMFGTDLFDSGDADYFQVGLLLGWGFSAK